MTREDSWRGWTPCIFEDAEHKKTRANQSCVYALVISCRHNGVIGRESVVSDAYRGRF